MSKLVQGALFIADHAGWPPPGVDVHALNTSVIASHLGKHTDYHEVNDQQTNNTSGIVNVQAMRQCMGRVCDEAPDDLAYQRLSDEDAADALIRVGTKGSSRVVLDRHDYNSETFRETMLPGFSDTTLSPENVHLPVWRSYWVAIQDIGQSRPFSNSDNHKYGTQKTRTEALNALIKRYGLTHSIESGSDRKEWRLTSAVLERCLKAVWSRENAGGSSCPDVNRLWTSGFQDWDAKVIEKIQEASGILHHHRKLLLYNAAVALVQESPGNTKEELPLPSLEVNTGPTTGDHNGNGKASDPLAQNVTSSSPLSSLPSSLFAPQGSNEAQSDRRMLDALGTTATHAGGLASVPGFSNIKKTGSPPKGENHKALGQDDFAKIAAPRTLSDPDITSSAGTTSAGPTQGDWDGQLPKPPNI